MCATEWEITRETQKLKEIDDKNAYFIPFSPLLTTNSPHSLSTPSLHVNVIFRLLIALSTRRKDKPRQSHYILDNAASSHPSLTGTIWFFPYKLISDSARRLLHFQTRRHQKLKPRTGCCRMVCCDWLRSEEGARSCVDSYWSARLSEGRCRYERSAVILLMLSQKFFSSTLEEKRRC
jgi:hypothetical protein